MRSAPRPFSRVASAPLTSTEAMTSVAARRVTPATCSRKKLPLRRAGTPPTLRFPNSAVVFKRATRRKGPAGKSVPATEASVRRVFTWISAVSTVKKSPGRSKTSSVMLRPPARPSWESSKSPLASVIEARVRPSAVRRRLVLLKARLVRPSLVCSMKRSVVRVWPAISTET